MVSVESDFPEFVVNGDVDTYIELADPPSDVRQKLQTASEDDRIRLLARAWANQFHGSRKESKRMYVMLMREKGIPFRGDDIRAITEDEPVETQT